MNNRIIAYARTSTNEQDLGIQVQLDAFSKFHPYKIYQEKISGRNIKRPELLKAIRMLRNGDTLLIYKLDRLGRSTQYLINLMNRLNDRNIHLLSIVEGLNTRTAQGRFTFTILSAMAELESELISQRTKDALKQTKKQIGRPRIDNSKRKRVIFWHDSKKMTNREIALKLDISESSVYNILRNR